MIEGIPLPAMMTWNLAVRKISEKNMLVYAVQERFNWLLSGFMSVLLATEPHVDSAAFEFNG